MEQVLRNILLFLSSNKKITKWARKYGLRLGASRFVAGTSLEHVIDVSKKLNGKGLVVTWDYLGEFIQKEEEIKKVVAQILAAIQSIRREKIDGYISVKLTSLGLDVSEELIQRHMRTILEECQLNGVFLNVDMEDFSRCEKTLQLVKEWQREYQNIGTVIQAYLYRAEEDTEDLKIHKIPLRLVKGAYQESSQVAFSAKKDVDENYKKIIKQYLLSGVYTAVATHDENIIEYTKQVVKEYHIAKEQFEFQMLYGIRTERQLELVNEGYTVRVYVPYGTDWFGYFMRRMAERPANLGFVLKSSVRK